MIRNKRKSGSGKKKKQEEVRKWEHRQNPASNALVHTLLLALPPQVTVPGW